MSYQSAQRVRSARRTEPTTRASATRDARRVAAQLYPGQPWTAMILSIESHETADPITLASQVRTVVIYDRALPSPVSLALALYELPGIVHARHDEDTGYITITRTA